MNRNIKFRAWDGEQMRYDLIVARPQFCNVLSILQDEEYAKELYKVKEWKVMQFTGLYDKDGKEIYEGDILQCKRYYATIKWWSTVSEIPEIEKRTEKQRNNFYLDKNVVRFNNGGFCHGYTNFTQFDIRNEKIVERLDTGRTYTSDFEEKWWDFEVIGNIYENQNLLKDEN